MALACSEGPQGREHWTMQLLADKLVELAVVESISDETVRRVLKKRYAPPLCPPKQASPSGLTQNAQAWQLAEHGRDRVVGVGEAMFEPTDS